MNPMLTWLIGILIIGIGMFGLGFILKKKTTEDKK